MNPEVMCREANLIDPSLGLAIIREDYTVKWANDKHLARWPNLTNEICYKYVNHFSRPCKWCPVQQTLSDGQVHEQLVCSPKGNDVEYSTIVSVPAGPLGNIREVIEIVFDNTEVQKQKYRERYNRYQVFSDFGGVLERLGSAAYIPDFFILGAVWKRCLAFPKAEIYVVEDTPHADGDTANPVGPRVHEVRSIEESSSLEDVTNDFSTALAREELRALWGRLKNTCVRVQSSPEGQLPILSHKLAETYKIDLSTCEHLLESTGRTVRLTPSLVATRIAGPEGTYVLVTQMTNTGHDLITDQVLLDVAIYASVAERAIRDRSLAMSVDSMIDVPIHDFLSP